MDIDELTRAAADHLAGRPVKIRWENPPTQSTVGQVVKTSDGQLIVYLANLEGINSRFKVLLHELAHCRLDHDFVPVSNDHTRQPGSIMRSQTEQASWREHPREKRADDLANEWLRYADRHAHEFWRAGRDKMTCKLLALLDWRNDK